MRVCPLQVGHTRQGQNKIMKFALSGAALADRDGIFTHIEVDSPHVAIVVG